MSEKDPVTLEDHQLSISSFRVWYGLKRRNRVDPSKKKMARRITFFVWITAPLRWIQNFLLIFRLPFVSLKNNPPLFILGHWRSGTTHLHYILVQDSQFAYLENFQAFMMRIAFVTKLVLKPALNFFMPSTRPSDNVKIDAHSPAEEEQPLANYTEKAGIHIFFFPRNRSYFDKYCLFKGVKKQEKKAWQHQYLNLLKKIALYNGKRKQLLLKNPFNTSRIKELLELFPGAKFIHIHRDPYEVFQSNLHHYEKMIQTQFLHEFNAEDIQERIVYCYETMMQKCIKEQSLIPSGNFVELSYQDLKQNPIGTIENIYRKLDLSTYDRAKDSIGKYLLQTQKYKPNAFAKLPEKTIQKINQRWKFAFDHWGYNMINGQ